MTELNSVEKRLQENLESTKQRIAESASKSGRTVDEITLVAVTKYVDAETTCALVRCGHHVLGESRPQSLWEKAERLKDESVQWHLIGHLQRNKVKRTIPYCTLVHSVDSIRLLQAIAANALEAGLCVDCLLEINVSGEQAKHGFAPAELESALVTAAASQAVRIKGLMAMASLAGDADRNRREFAQLRELSLKHSSFAGDNVEMSELSMGMSGDFEAAIEEGATIVRIGSVLFDGILNR